MSCGDGYRSHGCGGRCWAPGVRGEGGRDQHHERGRPDLGGLCSTDWRFPGRYHQGGPACGGVPPPLALLGAYRTPGPVVILTAQLGPAVSTAALIGQWTVGKVASVALVKPRLELPRLTQHPACPAFAIPCR